MSRRRSFSSRNRKSTENRQIRFMDRPHHLAAFRGRCLCHRSGVLQAELCQMRCFHVDWEGGEVCHLDSSLLLENAVIEGICFVTLGRLRPHVQKYAPAQASSQASHLPSITAFSPSIPAAVTYLSTLLRLASAQRLASIPYKYVFIPLIPPPCRQNIRSSGAGFLASLASVFYSHVFSVNPGISHERQAAEPTP